MCAQIQILQDGHSEGGLFDEYQKFVVAMESDQMEGTGLPTSFGKQPKRQRFLSKYFKPSFMKDPWEDLLTTSNTLWFKPSFLEDPWKGKNY